MRNYSVTIFESNNTAHSLESVPLDSPDNDWGLIQAVALPLGRSAVTLRTHLFGDMCPMRSKFT